VFRLLDRKKQDKIQQVKDPRQSNVENLNNVRREATRHFRNKKKVYLKIKFKEIKLTLKPKILGTCIGASLALKGVTSLELI
jgi:hypothetical protein